MQTIDVEKDVNLLQELKNRFGDEIGLQTAHQIFTNDFHSRAWEVLGSDCPVRISYFHRVAGIDGDKFVHDRDLAWGKDILEGIDQNLQGGLEYSSIENAKKEALHSKPGQVISVVSPQGHYPLTHAYIIEDIDGELFREIELQSQFLDLEKSAKLLNWLSDERMVPDQPSRVELMLAIGIRDGFLDICQILDYLGSLTGFNLEMNQDLLDEIEKRAKVSASEYIKTLEGRQPQLSKAKQLELLKNTLPYVVSGTVTTSCETIDFGEAKLPSWVEKNSFGEFRCKLCQKNLSRTEVNSHRCVC